MKKLATITLTAGAVLLASAAVAQDKVDGLPKTEIQVAGALSNLTLYQNFEQPFWTKTVPELSNGQVTATIKGFNEMGLKGPEMLRLMSQGVIPVGTSTLAYFASDNPINEAIDRLVPAGAVYFHMAEDDVRRIMAYPHTMIGSDGIPRGARPHPRLWGTFPRVLGHYARNLQLFSLEKAVHKMTGLAATTFRLKDRGFVRQGAFADLVLFDPARVIDTATYEDPEQRAAGIEAVVINGEIMLEKGSIADRRVGRVLKRAA